MKVTEVMVTDPATAAPQTPVIEISRVMRQRNIGSVILVEDGKPVGIVTERDLVHRVLAEGKHPTFTKAIDVCTRPVVATTIHSDVDDAVNTMSEYKIRRLVIVDDKDRIAGILTTDDLCYSLRQISEEVAVKLLCTASRRRS